MPIRSGRTLCRGNFDTNGF